MPDLPARADSRQDDEMRPRLLLVVSAPLPVVKRQALAQVPYLLRVGLQVRSEISACDKELARVQSGRRDRDAARLQAARPQVLDRVCGGE